MKTCSLVEFSDISLPIWTRLVVRFNSKTSSTGRLPAWPAASLHSGRVAWRQFDILNFRQSVVTTSLFVMLDRVCRHILWNMTVKLCIVDVLKLYNYRSVTYLILSSLYLSEGHVDMPLRFECPLPKGPSGVRNIWVDKYPALGYATVSTIKRMRRYWNLWDY